ncbi:hypothetical protein BKA64DRAFT_684070 [Cadophora sp. MPI-SDFR-AT-0126]|nr:hypothetical protein BKA64DRAFT_684070 [Leotiomycetes sp. MPI-SDFR-AT-0126]
MTLITSLADQEAVSIPTPLTPYLNTYTQPPNPTLPICISCQAAVLPKSLLEHLRKHHQLPAELRGIVKEFIGSLPGEARGADFGDVKIGDDGSEIVKELRVVQAWRCKVVVREEGSDGEGDGSRGKECGLIRKDVTDLRRHVNLEHGMGAKGAYEACKAQSWFGGRRAVYWRAVERRNAGDGDADMDGGEDVVMSDVVHGQKGLLQEGGMGSDKDVNEEVPTEKADVESEQEGQTKKLQTPVFTSLCRWGFYGEGFGNMTPKPWRIRDGIETEIEKELRLGKIC